MKRLETILIFLLLYTIFACTEKKNTLGFNEEITPLDSLTINLDISDAYSFNDSLSITSSSSKIMIGNFEREINKEMINRTAFGLFKFPETPDSIKTIKDIFFEITPQDSLKLKNKFYNFQVKKIITPWEDRSVSFLNASIDSLWDWETGINTWEKIEVSSSTTDSTFKINLNKMAETIKIEWNNPDSIYGFSLNISNPNEFLEIYSSEIISNHKIYPKLSFNYTTINEPDSLKTYEQEANSDTFIMKNADKIEKYQNKLLISNCFPIHNVVKFLNPHQNIIESDEEDLIQDSVDVKLLNINKAEIIFSKKQNPDTYLQHDKITLFPYALIKDSYENYPLTSIEDYQIISNSVFSTEEINKTTDDEIMINITGIFQDFISEEIENKGILFKSLGQSSNFDFIEFSPNNIKLKIWYTPNFMNEEE